MNTTVLTKEQKRRNRQNIKRQQVDRQRGLRVVKYLDFSSILSGSPVEIKEGYVVSDRETCDVFASIIFKNVGQKEIKKLNIQLWCYLNQNIPYQKLSFSYSHDDLTFGIIESKQKEMRLRDANKKLSVGKNECFGSCVFIPLPETYFTRLEVYIESVEYLFGEIEDIGIVAGGSARRYNELDNISRLVYTRINIYKEAEYTHPSVVLPQETDSAWLCCCGNKNSKDLESCERCGRERDWQMNNISGSALEETKKDFVSDPTERVMHDKSKFRQDKMLETDEEIAAKVEKYEKAIQNLAEEERRKHSHRRTVIKRTIITLLIMAILYLIIYIIQSDGVFFPYAM